MPSAHPADSGRPTLVAEPDGKVSGLYKAMARLMAAGLSKLPKDYSGKLPGVSVAPSEGPSAGQPG